MFHFRRASVVFALALALALPGAALAATTTSTSSATVTVDSTISMVGVPASYSFGHITPGNDVTGPTFSIVVTSSETAYTVTAASTDFTSGGNSITVGGHLTFTVNSSPFGITAAGTPVEIGTTSPLSTKATLTIPGAAKSGSYTGTFTFTASN